ncbi:MAG: hypothetical protein Q4P30_00135 [Eubacteriales bacterium]|nr:hypothetical protein [Eubacteriales bacterium]
MIKKRYVTAIFSLILFGGILGGCGTERTEEVKPPDEIRNEKPKDEKEPADEIVPVSDEEREKAAAFYEKVLQDPEAYFPVKVFEAGKDDPADYRYMSYSFYDVKPGVAPLLGISEYYMVDNKPTTNLHLMAYDSAKDTGILYPVLHSEDPMHNWNIADARQELIESEWQPDHTIRLARVELIDGQFHPCDEYIHSPLKLMPKRYQYKRMQHASPLNDMGLLEIFKAGKMAR